MNKIFYKYRQINNNTIDSIRNNYFYCSQPSQLNDWNDSELPVSYDFDMSSFLDWIYRNGYDAFKDQLVNNIDIFSNKAILNELEEKHKKLNQGLRIFCLSEVWNDSQMWGHYAESNYGICLGYKAYFNYNAFLLKVLKQDNPFIVKDGDKKVMVLLKVYYDKTEIHPFNLFQGNQEALIEAFRSKEEKWSYEKEYRLVYMNTSAVAENKKVYYDKRVLAEVIFGIRTTEDKMKEVYDAVFGNYDISRIIFYKLEKDGTLGIRREKIDF